MSCGSVGRRGVETSWQGVPRAHQSGYDVQLLSLCCGSVCLSDCLSDCVCLKVSVSDCVSVSVSVEV